VLQQLQCVQLELSGLVAASASLAALCKDDKKLHHTLSEQVTFAQQQLIERDKTVAEMRAQLHAANEELRTAQSNRERERLTLNEQVGSVQQQLTERDQIVADLQAQLQVANEELCAIQVSGEEERLVLTGQVGSLQQQLTDRDQTVPEREELLKTTSKKLDAALAEKESAEQRAAQAELELNTVRTLAPEKVQRSSPAPASTAEPAKLAADLARTALMSECDTVITQFVHVPVLMDALQQRDQLQAQLEAAEMAGEDYELLGTLGVQLETLKVRVTQLPLCEESHATLAVRPQALVQKLTAACEALATTKAYAELKFLGAKLNELKGLDASALPQPWINDPVLLPAPHKGEDVC
jgi:DNA repair exonuclease SbcCD ATPase subunit